MRPVTGDLLTAVTPPSRRAATVGEAGYERRPLDAYFTPAWCTEALLAHLKLGRDRIAEPMCGDGAIAKVLLAAGHYVRASDVHDYGAGYPVRDFLSIGRDELRADGLDIIISNPPYEGGATFIQHALWLTAPSPGGTPAGLVAMILRHEYDCAKERRPLFADHPAFACKLTLTKRPKWSDDDKASPRFPFAWFIWKWQHQGAPTLAYGP